jgi:hypothetical protein
MAPLMTTRYAYACGFSAPVSANRIRSRRIPAEQGLSQKTQTQIADKAKQKARDLQAELDDALGREHSLLMELYEVRKQLSKLTGESVLPIRRKRQ